MIKKETIIRLLVLIFVLGNQILVSLGIVDFELGEDKIYEIVSTLATIAISLYTAWKNNSITKPAIKADEYLKELKEKKDVEKAIL